MPRLAFSLLWALLLPQRSVGGVSYSVWAGSTEAIEHSLPGCISKHAVRKSIKFTQTLRSVVVHLSLNMYLALSHLHTPQLICVFNVRNYNS